MPAKKKDDHVVMRVPNVLLCLHCGQHYEMALPAPVDLVAAMGASFSRLHGRCVKTDKGLACSFCFAFGHEPDKCLKAQYQGSVQKWLDGPDTGLSSRAICLTLSGRYCEDTSTPCDPSDFGRCYRLLKAIPNFRARIGQMAKVRGWKKLVDNWEELERLYEEELPSGSAPRLYARIKELTR